MPRAIWKGYLRLSLVSCPVAVYTATTTAEKVAFNTLNRTTGNRIKQQLVDSATEEPVDPSDRVKGYQVSKGQYVLVEDDELEALKIEGPKVMDIEAFVPQSEVDQLYLDSPYFIAPDDRVAEEAFSVIREAMDRQKVVGLGRVVMSRRERIVMLQPRGKGLLGTTLRYPYEVREDAEYFSKISDVELPEDLLDVAQMLISRKSGRFEPEKFTDRYEEAVVGLIRAKQAGEAFVVPEAAAPTKVVSIMEALKKSLEAEGGAAATPTRRPKAPSKKPAAAEPVRKPKARKTS